MKRRSFLPVLLALCVAPASVAAQDEPKKQSEVLIPSQMELTDAQKKDLKSMLDKELKALLKQCVSSYPRPEFFGTFSVQFELRKSGDLRGNYIPSGVVDSNMYVKSDEERSKLEEEGSFARLVVRNDRDLERCLKKGTREFVTAFDRISARVSVTYEVKWNGKTPSLKSTEFEITKG